MSSEVRDGEGGLKWMNTRLQAVAMLAYLPLTDMVL